jgi:hypothetical protein
VLEPFGWPLEHLRRCMDAREQHHPGPTNESEFERHDDALAFPSEEQRDPGRCLLDSN